MKTFFLSLSLSLIAVSAHAQDFCLAKKEIIPYSPLARISAECNGKRIEATSLFGNKLQEKFLKKLKENGYKVIMNLEKRILFSKLSRTELDVIEVCLVTKLSNIKKHVVECDNGQSLMLNSIAADVVTNFAKSYNYNILQGPEGKNGIYVLSR